MAAELNYYNRFKFPSTGAYMGFDKEHEYYYRDGKTITCKSGDLFLALADISDDDILDRDITSDYYQFNDSEFFTVEINRADYSQFADSFIFAYDYFSSMHIALGDSFISPLFRYHTNEIPFGDKAPLEAKDAVLELWNQFLSSSFQNSVSYGSFNKHGFLSVFKDDKFLQSPNFSYIANYLLSCYRKSISEYFVLQGMIRHYFLKILESNDFPSINYIRFLEESIANTSSESWIADFQDLVHPTHPLPRLFPIVATPSQKRYSSYRLAYFYDICNLSDLAYAEFEFLCMNNMSLSRCKNCNKPFFPLTRASSFCERPIDNWSGRTCRSSSSRWYAQNETISDPAYTLYLKYKKRYYNRSLRNSDAYPFSQYDNWVKTAKAHMRDCQNSKITYEKFEQLLKEMDKDMKPLDKM